jgi:hypothetical protein
MTGSVVGEIAHQMALVPFLWLAALRARGARVDAAWFWLAGAFFVSWLADSGAHFVDPWLMSLVYPVSQAALVVAVLLERREALLFVGALVAVGVVAVAWQGVGAPDVLVHTVAWLGVALVVYDRDALGRLRLALLVSFGVCWLVWLCYTVWPGWTAWLAYQCVRALGIACFCWAASKPTPRLRIA